MIVNNFSNFGRNVFNIFLSSGRVIEKLYKHLLVTQDWPYAVKEPKPPGNTKCFDSPLNALFLCQFCAMMGKLWSLVEERCKYYVRPGLLTDSNISWATRLKTWRTQGIANAVGTSATNKDFLLTMFAAESLTIDITSFRASVGMASFCQVHSWVAPFNFPLPIYSILGSPSIRHLRVIDTWLTLDVSLYPSRITLIHVAWSSLCDWLVLTLLYIWKMKCF